MASSSLASTPVVQMDIFVKQVGKEAVLVSVSVTDTAETIRMVLQLGNTKIRLKQRVLKKDETLESCGIKTGDTLTVFANNQPPKSSGTESFAVYQAKQRMVSGRAVSSYKHKDLQRQTQSVVLEESAHLSRKMDAVGQDVVEQTNTVMMEETGLICRKVN